jgi:ArsR family transcriptional regulator
MPSALANALAGQLFQALGDSTRQRLLQLLTREELSVSELVAILRLPQSTVSRHLRVLHAAGLALDRRDGTTVLYRPSEPQGGDEALQALLLNWIRSCPLSKRLEARLAVVLRKRRDQSVGFFDRMGSRWDTLRSDAFGEAFALEAFLALLPRHWTVADVGTGTGFLLPALAEHFQQVIAVDPAPAMLECARQRLAGQQPGNVGFHVGNLERLPLEAQTCDLAIACLVLHHVTKPPAALTEMHRILRHGGRLLVIEQEGHEYRGFHEAMQDHWWGFEPAALCEQVAAAGFDEIRHHALQTAKQGSGVVEVPSLFVLTGQRARAESAGECCSPTD